MDNKNRNKIIEIKKINYLPFQQNYNNVFFNHCQQRQKFHMSNENYVLLI